MTFLGYDGRRRHREVLSCLEAISRKQDKILATLEKFQMAISAEVQKVIDDIAANSSIAKSSAAALGLLAQQITDLQAQIAALQAGGVLSAEDKAALVQGAADLEATNTALQAATPASTPAAGG